MWARRSWASGSPGHLWARTPRPLCARPRRLGVRLGGLSGLPLPSGSEERGGGSDPAVGLEARVSLLERRGAEAHEVLQKGSEETSDALEDRVRVGPEEDASEDPVEVRADEVEAVLRDCREVGALEASWKEPSRRAPRKGGPVRGVEVPDVGAMDARAHHACEGGCEALDVVLRELG